MSAFKNGGSFVIIKNRTLRYGAIQGFYWMSYVAVIGYSSVYLLHVGFDNSQVGLLIAVTGLLAALFQQVLAGYADRRGGAPLKKMICCIAGVSLACIGGAWLTQSHKLLTGFLFGSCMVVLLLNIPLVNALGVATVNGGEKLNFGISRSFGSMGSAAAGFLLGMVTNRYGAGSVPLCIGAVLALLLLSTAAYPKVAKSGEAQEAQGSVTDFLRRYPRFCLVLVGLVLLYISHAVLNNFNYQVVTYMGGDSANMGVSMALVAIFELPPMFLFGWMQKKRPVSFWFRLSSIFYVLKNMGTLLCKGIPAYYAVQLLQMGGFAVQTVSSAFYVNSIMAPGDRVKGHACYAMTLTMGNVLGALVAGRILDNRGVPAMLAFGLVCSLAGAALLLAFTEKAE